MVQMAGKDSCERVLMMLRDVVVFGKKLAVKLVIYLLIIRLVIYSYSWLRPYCRNLQSQLSALKTDRNKLELLTTIITLI